jgi:hypothetical protein
MSGLPGLPVSQGAKSNSEFAVYRALYDYTPSEQDIAEGCLVVCCGDLLQVQRPFVVASGTEWKPEGKFIHSCSYISSFSDSRELQWLPIPERNHFKIANLCYRAVHAGQLG